MVLEAFTSVGSWASIEDLELNLTLPELTHIVDMIRFLRHNDYDLLAKVVTGEGIGEYSSMTDLGESTEGHSSDMTLDSEFTISHLPIGLGYEGE